MEGSPESCPVDAVVTLGESRFRGVGGEQSPMERVQEKKGEVVVTVKIGNSFEEFYPKRETKNRVVAEECDPVPNDTFFSFSFKTGGCKACA